MPLDYSDPHVIRFILENYDSENEQRIAWFLAHKDELIQQSTLTDKYKGYRITDILQVPIEIGMSMLSRQHITNGVNRRKKVSLDGPVFGLSRIKKDAALKPTVPLMKPVDAAERSILYGRIPVGGRRRYLSARNRKIPEERYNFCETSSNVIGWQWKDSAFPRRLPKYGRRDILLRETSRSGPQPDPPHYRQPQGA